MAEQDAVVAEQNIADPLEGESKESGGKGSLLFILLPVMLISAGIGSWLAYSQYPALAELAYNTFDKGEGEDYEPIEFGEFMELSNIVVNPSDSEGRRLLMVSLGLETEKSSILESVVEREMVVRDTIIKILGRRTTDELSSIDERNMIKDELRHAVNGIVSDGEINRLYFTQYVLQ